MTVYDAFLKIARGNKALHKLAAQMMKDDKSDGIRFAKYLEKHWSIFREMVDDAQGYSDLTQEEIDGLFKAAGDEG